MRFFLERPSQWLLCLPLLSANRRAAEQLTRNVGTGVWMSPEMQQGQSFTLRCFAFVGGNSISARLFLRLSPLLCCCASCLLRACVAPLCLCRQGVPVSSPVAGLALTPSLLTP